jgi:clan AA aspartic protease
MVEFQVANHARGQNKSIRAWIDTAFDGHLVMSKAEIERFGLGVLADTDAILANGSKARLRCYYCIIEWMGQIVPVQVVENVGGLPLIGTALLSSVDLRINYRDRVCTLS